MVWLLPGSQEKDWGAVTVTPSTMTLRPGGEDWIVTATGWGVVVVT